MRVKLTKEWPAVLPGGSCWPVRLPEGKILEGELAELALGAGAGVLCDGSEPPAQADGDGSVQAAGDGADRPQGADAPPPDEITSADANARRVARAKLKDAYSGPDHEGNPVALKKSAYVKGALAHHLVTIGAASPVEYETA